jgi:ATP-dependent DNA helicase RecQ
MATHPDPGTTTAASGKPVSVLRKHFGHDSFREGQLELIEAVLGGRDALGILPTGGGKSICYQVPALMLGGLTIVVSPLVSLMADQVGRAEEAGLAAAALHSGLTSGEYDRVERRLSSGEIRLLLLAPERFGSSRFARVLPGLRVSLLTIDEAHCIAMWGHDFRPSYRNLGEVRAGLGAPVLALTATATPRVGREIEEVLRMKNPVRVVGSFDRSNLRWAVVQVSHGANPRREKVRRAGELVRRFHGARLVYASTRGRVESIRNALARRGMRAEAYHAGLPQSERDRVQEYFMRNERPLVVATNAFGMGIDRSDVRIVIHDQLSGSIEDYYQEAGRAGRDGAPALCLAFFHPDDQRVHRSFLDRSYPQVRTPVQWMRLTREGELRFTIERRRAGLSKLKGIALYARTSRCRRAIVLEWFGEESSGTSCSGCDRCTGWPGLLDSLTGE